MRQQALRHGGTGVSLAEEEELVAATTVEGALVIWNLQDDTSSVLLQLNKRISCCCFGHRAALILMGDWGRAARLIDTATGQERAEMVGHDGKVTGCKLRMEAHTALTSSEDFSLKIWDIRRGIYKSFTASDEALDCCFIPNSTKILGACKDGKLIIWDTRKEDKQLMSIGAHEGWATCCDVTEDGWHALTGGSDKLAKVWDLRGGKNLQVLTGHKVKCCLSWGFADGIPQESVNCCRFLDDFAVTGSGNRFWESKDNTVIQWDIHSGKHVKFYRGAADAVMSIACSREKQIIIAACMDKSVRLWNSTKNEKKKREKSQQSSLESRSVCPLGCGLQVEKLNVDQHLEECPERLLLCEICSSDVRAKDLEMHKNTACKERTYVCDLCHEVVKMIDQRHHQLEVCIQREVLCPRAACVMQAWLWAFNTRKGDLDASAKHLQQSRGAVQFVRLGVNGEGSAIASAATLQPPVGAVQVGVREEVQILGD
eukprot:762759-Hanusia_phi.AAC.1